MTSVKWSITAILLFAQAIFAFLIIFSKFCQLVELKAREFEPTDAGQLNFYLSAIDDLVKDENENPSIGLLLCKTKDKFTAEFALKDINKPIGVSEYKLLEDIPEYLQAQLPKAEDIELHIKEIEE